MIFKLTLNSNEPVRLYAYTLDSFNHTKSILNLNNKDFLLQEMNSLIT